MLGHRAQHLAELADVVGFGDHAAEPVAPVVGHDGVVRIAAGDDDAGVGVDFQQLADGLAPTHAAGYGQIHDYGVKAIPGLDGLPIQPQRFLAFLGEGRAVAQATQKVCHHAADRRLVVQNQNTAPTLNDADIGLDVAELLV